MDLGGNPFDVLLYCTDGAGDYCSGKQLKQEEFLFDNGDFEIASFENEFGGLSGSGEYSEGTVFEAQYTIYSEDLDMYEFKISGINLLDVIVGMATIRYVPLIGNLDDIGDVIDDIFDDIFGDDDDDDNKEEEATAYFIGIRN